MNIATQKRSSLEVSSKAAEYYSEYWTDDICVGDKTDNLSKWIIDNYLPNVEGKRLLEVGVGGEGGLIRRLSQTNEVCGVDVSPSAVRNCTRLGLHVLICDLSVEKLPYGNSSFDFVFALEVFEHFANPQAAIEEIIRVLDGNGTVLISVPTPWSYHWPRLFYPSLFDSKESFSEFLVANRFNVIRQDDGVVPCNTKRNIPERFKVWNWYFLAQKISDVDAEALLQAGLYFWNKVNQYGVRRFPVESIDFFRKSWQLSGADKALLLLGRSLLYRLLSGEVTEFSEVFSLIQRRNDEVSTKVKEGWDQGVAMMLLEAELLGVPLSSTISNVREFVRSRPTLVGECKKLGIIL